MYTTKLAFICIFAYFSICTLPSFAQDSSRLRISLLTCTPGAELYSTFGHSALRVIDSNAVTDIVYNYGTFDFDDPDFYSKFVRGKLLYVLGTEEFKDFLAGYQWENRGVTEQLLDFSGQEKLNIRQFLFENLKEENRWYKYDFTFDNCTSRLRDIIVKQKRPAPQLPAVMPGNYTFRNAIHYYLDNNHHYWSKLGIDLLLGSRMDVKMSTAQQQFLPDNLMYALDSTRNIPLVAAKNSLYTARQNNTALHWFTPLLLFSALCTIWVLAGFSQNSRILKTIKVLDRFLFFTTGLLGLLLLFMWLGTDHYMTKANYNLLWAIPTHFAAAFMMNKKSMRKYFAFTALLSAALLLLWFFLPQQLNPALLPMVILLMMRSFSIYKRKEI